ncbi:substrate-binding domain-containing protein [Streptomyces sp. TRM 70361]|uniref:substrate-binding domain-containing protein n=1 Tax=Streptomyces sp. TRM 70361 TaxID=3116553 RepID=UPI002E7B5D04|nr:substrate-binding domain-containing protein [Streptomyces sp. TRM 70361]MEE1938177.1 substrate-binding domain-containing protein [Streptomyces sp. TRM 70361]
MEWLSAETVLGTLGIVATVAVLAYDRLRPGRRRIGYRVQMDTAIGADTRPGRAGARLGLFGDDRELTDATLVLLRIENDGVKDISRADYEVPLCAVFTGRRVLGVAVTDPSPPGLMERLTPENGLRYEGGRVHVPHVPLNTGDHFKLLVLLTGGGLNGDVRLEGTVNEGRIRPNRQYRGPRVLYLGLAAFLILITGIGTGMQLEGPPPPLECATGELTVLGSTAFAPVLEEVGRAYEEDCEGARITLAAEGSLGGIRRLDSLGRAAKDGAPPAVALSDGPAPDGYPRLRAHPVAVTVFAVVVNERTGVRDISTADLRRLYSGEVRNWREVGGADLPVSLVSRDSESGTRSAFQRRVLDGFEPGVSSGDCRRRDDPRARVLRCERGDTRQVLETVRRVPGAIGYAELRAATGTGGVTLLRLDGTAPDTGAIGPDRRQSGRDGREATGKPYPYWEVEYAHTYTQPPADSLTSKFLDYLGGGTAQNILRTHGLLPCAAPVNQALCHRG